MNRYYLSPIIGSGTEADPYRPQVADYVKDWWGTFQSDANGHPAQPWCLVLVNAEDHSKLLADDNFDPLPNLPMHMPLTLASAQSRSRVEAAAARRGIDLSRVETMAEMVSAAGRSLDPTFRIPRALLVN